jgi:cytochrome c biogenesis protein CcmG, thiol:disulfide interchange protein DsbE
MKSLRFLLPLSVFIALAAFLYAGLYRNPREVPSPLVGKPTPSFAAPSLHDPQKTLTRETFMGKPWILNVWGSWCQPCREEHPVVIDLAKRSGVAVVGLNYKDTRPNAQRWLNNLGDPYAASIFDEAGRVGLDFGVYGVPETFVIDAQGVIRLKHTGPLTQAIVKAKIEPVLKEVVK